jgi:tetratricopeptide (TPR) repeat protein
MGLFDFLFKVDETKKEYTRILQECDQALALNDKNPDLWKHKCYVLLILGRPQEAIEAGKIAVELAPNDSNMWEALSQSYSHGGEPQKVDECQKKAADLIEQKKEADRQRLKEEGSSKECCRCGVYVKENVRCIPCGGDYFCPNCFREHEKWAHWKPRIQDYY